jgi:hypothetical protein
MFEAKTDRAGSTHGARPTWRTTGRRDGLWHPVDHPGRDRQGRIRPRPVTGAGRPLGRELRRRRRADAVRYRRPGLHTWGGGPPPPHPSAPAGTAPTTPEPTSTTRRRYNFSGRLPPRPRVPRADAGRDLCLQPRRGTSRLIRKWELAGRAAALGGTQRSRARVVAGQAAGSRVTLWPRTSSWWMWARLRRSGLMRWPKKPGPRSV